MKVSAGDDEPRWTVRTVDGKELPPDVATVVEKWLALSNGEAVEALVLAAQEFVVASASASFGLCRGRVELAKGALTKKGSRK